MRSIALFGGDAHSQGPESFFHSLKSDVIHGRTFDDDHALNLVVRRYVRRYNRIRLHSSLSYLSPINYERNAA
jgi:putative transposase